MECMYISNSINAANAFINANTDWKRFNDVCYFNGDEKIIIVAEVNRIRGRRFGKAYYDSGFFKLPQSEQDDFNERVSYMGIDFLEVRELTSTGG